MAASPALKAKGPQKRAPDCLDIFAGALDIAFGLGRDGQGACVYSLGKLVEVVGKTGLAELAKDPGKGCMVFDRVFALRPARLYVGTEQARSDVVAQGKTRSVPFKGCPFLVCKPE
jgi:hypothetical protein